MPLTVVIPGYASHRGYTRVGVPLGVIPGLGVPLGVIPGLGGRGGLWAQEREEGERRSNEAKSGPCSSMPDYQLYVRKCASLGSWPGYASGCAIPASLLVGGSYVTRMSERCPHGPKVYPPWYTLAHPRYTHHGTPMHTLRYIPVYMPPS